MNELEGIKGSLMYPSGFACYDVLVHVFSPLPSFPMSL